MTAALSMVMVSAGFLRGWCVTSGRPGTAALRIGPEAITVEVASGPGGLGGPCGGAEGVTLTFFAARKPWAASGSECRLSSLQLRPYGLGFSVKNLGFRPYGL